jgi:ubiquinone/menaquinone biosynthesis C-methylase UbiE
MTTTTPGTAATTADRELKAKHRALWASGDYPEVASGLIPTLGPALVAYAGIAAGQRVLDVAAGSGNASVPAALTGAQVVACDLTPELFVAGRAHAAAAGVDIEWVEADAENLPFADGEFDSVISCVGAMFAPRHQRTADELLRVTRPGGTISLLSWTPEGMIGHLFKTMGPFAPPPAPGAQPPPLWGSEAHVAALFGDRVSELRTQRQTVGFRQGPPEEFREYWKRNYGPTIAVYAFNAADPERVAALDAAFTEFLASRDLGEAAPARYEAEYLLVSARKAG